MRGWSSAVSVSFSGSWSAIWSSAAAGRPWSPCWRSPRPTSCSAARSRCAKELIGGVIPTPEMIVELASHGGPRLEDAAHLAAADRLARAVNGAAVPLRAGRGGGDLHRRPPLAPVPYAALLVPLALLGLSIALGTLTPAAVLSRAPCSRSSPSAGRRCAPAAAGRPSRTVAAARTRVATVAVLLAVAVVGGLLRRTPPARLRRRRPHRLAHRAGAAVRRQPVPQPAGRVPQVHRAQRVGAVRQDPLRRSRACPQGMPVRVGRPRLLRRVRLGRRQRRGRGRRRRRDRRGRPTAPRRSAGSAATSPPAAPARGDGDGPVRPGGYADVWLPTAGAVTGIDFEGDADRATALGDDLRFNVDTNTGVVPEHAAGRRHLHSSPRWSRRSTRRPAQAPSTSPTAPSSTPRRSRFIDDKIDAVERAASTASGRRSSPIAKAMQDGAYTDGGAARRLPERLPAGPLPRGG